MKLYANSNQYGSKNKARVFKAMRALGYNLWHTSYTNGPYVFSNYTHFPGTTTSFLSLSEIEEFLNDVIENGPGSEYSYEEQDYLPELIESILTGSYRDDIV